MHLTPVQCLITFESVVLVDGRLVVKSKSRCTIEGCKFSSKKDGLATCRHYHCQVQSGCTQAFDKKDQRLADHAKMHDNKEKRVGMCDVRAALPLTSVSAPAKL